jgi:hypothetical protein
VNIAKYKSHALKKSFKSLKELEIIQSCAVITEGLHEDALNDEYFNINDIHIVRYVDLLQRDLSSRAGHWFKNVPEITRHSLLSEVVRLPRLALTRRFCVQLIVPSTTRRDCCCMSVSASTMIVQCLNWAQGRNSCFIFLTRKESTQTPIGDARLSTSRPISTWYSVLGFEAPLIAD